MKKKKIGIWIFEVLILLLNPISSKAGFNNFINRRHQRAGNQRVERFRADRKSPSIGNYYPARARSFSVRASMGSGVKLTDSCGISNLDWRGSEIIFRSSKDNDLLDIFKISSSGGSMVQLTVTSEAEFDPKFSNDGSKIYYVVWTPSPGYYIKKMNSDGSNKITIKQFTENVELDEFLLSPIETKIAYTLREENNNSLWIMNVDGTNETELSKCRHDEFDFSPDGNYIVFISTDSKISKVNIITKEVTLLSTYQSYGACDWSHVEDKIVYGGMGGIAIINSDGTGQTSLGVSGYYPKFSPDGTMIVYCYQGDYWVMSSTGANKKVIVNFKNVNLNSYSSFHVPVWSPDSAKIAYTDEQNIFVINVDGTNLQKITNNTLPINNGNPKWNGDFTKICYVAEYPYDNYKLMVMDAGGSNKVEISTAIKWWGYSFAPHNTKIVYTVYTGEKNITYGSGSITWDGKDIYSINCDGTGKQQLTTDSQSKFPSWSPDKAKIAYYASDYPNSGKYLKIMEADGSNQTTLTEAICNYSPPVWSNDGTEIAYLSGTYNNCSIWIMNVASPSQKAEVVSGLYYYCYPSFSPNGTKIAYSISYDYDSPDKEGLWVVNRNGSANTQIYSGTMSDIGNIIWAGNDRIYFSDNSLVCSIKPDGTDLKQGNYWVGNFDLNPSDGSNIIYNLEDIFAAGTVEDEIEQDPPEFDSAQMKEEKLIVLGQAERQGVINTDKGPVKFIIRGEAGEKYKIIILNLLGEKVYEKDVILSLSYSEISWIPGNIASGIYIAVIDGPGVKEKKKFAIVR